MENSIEESKKELLSYFIKIKDRGLVKAIGKDWNDIGFTFETLIGKKPDESYMPDYKGIEIKTKLGYSKSPITLFTLTPTRNGESAAKYLLEKYGYPNKSFPQFKSLGVNAWHDKYVLSCNRYYFLTQVEIENNCIRLLVYDKKYNLVDSSVIWDLIEIKKRLYAKLCHLAIIKGYTYNCDGKKFYKYTNLKFYKLRNFSNFIDLLNSNKIFVTLNIRTYTGEYRFGEIHNTGCAFKISLDSIDYLFESD